MYLDEIRAYRPQSEQEDTDRRVMLAYAEAWPDTILTRENEFAHITSSGFIVNRDASKVLFAHHNLYRVWAWTGGHADGEDDLLAVALREAREETGIERVAPLSREIMSLDILPVWGHEKRGRHVAAHQHLNVAYLLLADEDAPIRPMPGENTKVDWLDADRLPELTGEWEMDGVYAKLLARARALLVGKGV